LKHEQVVVGKQKMEVKEERKAEKQEWQEENKVIEKLLDEEAELKRKLSEMTEEYLKCKLCLSAQVACCLYRCGHTLCLKCAQPYVAKKLIQCPVCRSLIVDTMKIYF